MMTIFAFISALYRHLETKPDCHGQPELTWGAHRAPALVIKKSR